MTTNEDKQNKYNAYMRERVQCKGCHKMVPRGHMSTHKKSAIHQKNTQDAKELKKYRAQLERKYDLKIESLQKIKKKSIDEKKEQICAAY